MGAEMRVARLLTVGMTLGVVGTAVTAGTALRRDGGDRVGEAPAAAPAVPTLRDAGVHNFYFVRAQYTDGGMYPNWKDWKTDFPKADAQFLTVFTRLADVDAFDEGLPIRLDDPELRRFPYLYAVEVGQMKLTEAEVEGLR